MMWDTIAEETNGEMAMEFASCQMPHDLNTVAAATSSNGATRQRQPRNILGSPINDMVVDHQLSFYGEEEHVEEPDQRSNVFDLPQQMGLLSPEGSPCRFQILQQQSVAKYNQGDNCQNGGRQRQSFVNRLQKLQHNNAANGNTRTPTPPKSLRIFHSLSSGSMGSSSMEEDYMDLFEMESLGNSMMPSNNMPKIPSDLDSLFVGQIKNILSPAHRTVEQPQLFEQLRTPEMRRPPVRRCLSMTDNCLPKTPETLLKQVQEIATSPYGVKLLTTERNQSAISGCFKRPDPPSKTNSPVLIKRYRIEAEKENLDDSLTMSLPSLPALPAPQPKLSHPPPLRKSMSMNDAEIMSALARSENKDEPDLIGDFSKPYVLPLMDGRHRDLKSISCETMARLVRGEFSNVVANYRIIDCRYPYEFEGGHIRGAQNLYTHEQILEEFLTQQKTEMEQRKAINDHRRNIIIFHCEFSSERGPKLSRFLRSTDRERNTNCYPSLDYPEIYLLHNGYKEFYEHHSELCDPTAYRPMLEPAYNSAYRHFRSKTKSWNGDSGLGGATGRLKKSRSRLML